MEYKISELKEFSEGLAAFRNYDDLWGFINKRGYVVIEPVFTNVIGNFKNGSCAVETGKYYRRKGSYQIYVSDPKYYLIDKHGNRLSKIYNSMSESSNGLRVVSRYRKMGSKLCYGYIDPKGKEVIECKYANAYNYDGKKCDVKNFDDFDYSIHYVSNIKDEIKESKKFEPNKEAYDKLKKEYREVWQIENYYIVSNGESFDDIYGGYSLGLTNNEGELIFPLCAYDIKKVDEDLFYIDKISESILLDTRKKDIDNVTLRDFTYETHYLVENNLLKELTNDKDFAIIVKRSLNAITNNYYLANKNYLENKIKVNDFDIFVVRDGKKSIYEDMKKVLKYLDLSKISFDEVDITYTDFIGSNAKIDPQTVLNKDFSGVRISAINIIHDKNLNEPNYDGIITDDNTDVVGEYLDYKYEMKLTKRYNRKN